MRILGCILLLAATLAYVACDQVPTETAQESEALFAKGGGKGKPGGRGDAPVAPEIAYITEDFELWVMNADGAHRTRVLKPADVGSNVIRNPAWSPVVGGTTETPSYSISFTNAPSGIMTVGIAITASSEITVDAPQLLSTGIEGPSLHAYSPDGSMVALIGRSDGPCTSGDPFDPDGYQEHSLYVVPATGGAAQEVFCSAAVTSYGLGDVSWSPDGTAIAFAGHFDPDGDGNYEPNEGEVRICNLVTATDGSLSCNTVTALAMAEADDFGTPSWSHDGSTLLFNSEVLGSASRKTTTCSVPLQIGPNGWRRVPGSTVGCWFRGIDAKWSPDDSQLVVNGVSLYSVATRRKTRNLDCCWMPDWRGPDPSAP